MKLSKLNIEVTNFLRYKDKNMQITEKEINIAREYARLATKSELSDLEADSMSQILELIMRDECLTFLVNEIDGFIAEELNF
jgi:hypothetical protein